MQKSLAEIQEEEAREAAAEAERKKKAVAARAPVATPNAYSSAASSGGWERGAPNVAPRAKSMLEEIQEQEEREAAAALQAARAGGGGVPAPQSRWAAKVGAGMGGMVVMEFALIAPQNVASLTLVSTHAGGVLAGGLRAVPGGAAAARAFPPRAPPTSPVGSRSVLKKD